MQISNQLRLRAILSAVTYLLVRVSF